MADTGIQTRMRDEWNERAREDAHYFVAFRRRDQDDEGFFATAVDVVRDLNSELRRLSSRERALEIGCGPGRLMRPMSSHFSEVHGIDVSDEMIARARQNLADVPNAHLHHASGSDLTLFPDNHFDFVYSYAVFQHIPSAEVVFSYLRETVRVLKPGGVARVQINGLPTPSRAYTTWHGVCVSSAELHALAREQNVRLLSLTGADTQYMWTTWQKPPACRIHSVTNALTSEQPVPASGRMACAALTVENLPGACDLNSFEALVDGVPGTVCYIGPRSHNAFSQVNVFLPPNARTGLLPVSLWFEGRLLCPESYVRVIPPGPSVPQLKALTDGINLNSPQRIESGLLKAIIEEVGDIGEFSATIDTISVEDIETVCTDPLTRCWEINFRIPGAIGSGGHVLELHLGRRLLVRTGIEVVR